jgi:hypothetical protein
MAKDNVIDLKKPEPFMDDPTTDYFTYDAFIDIYEAKYPKAVECLKKDRDVLFTIN